MAAVGHLPRHCYAHGSSGAEVAQSFPPAGVEAGAVPHPAAAAAAGRHRGPSTQPVAVAAGAVRRHCCGPSTPWAAAAVVAAPEAAQGR